MEKTSLAYSKSFQGTFGNYKSLEYLDRLNEEGKVSPIFARMLRKVFLTANYMTAEAKRLPPGPFKDFVILSIRDHLVKSVYNINIKDTVQSVSLNFVVTKCKEARKP